MTIRRFLTAAFLTCVSFLTQTGSAHAQSYFYGYYYPDEQRFHTNQIIDGGYDYYGVPYWMSSKGAAKPTFTPRVITQPTTNQPASIRVIVPTADAVVWFGEHQTKSIGTDRLYQTRGMLEGTSGSYQLKVAYSQGGQQFSLERTVSVKAGQSVVVDFGPAAVSVSPQSVSR